MIRLVHQFDAPKARPTAAAPKSSGCCCCCCCCIVTTGVASVLTARAVGSVPATAKPPPQFIRKIELAPPEASSAYRPEPRVVEVEVAPPLPMGTPPHILWKVLGFCLLPLSIICAALCMQFSPAVSLWILAFLYVGGLLIIQRKVGFPTSKIIILTLTIPVFLCLEALAWIFAILK